MKSKVIGVNYVPLLNTEDSGFVPIQSIKFEATQHCKHNILKSPPNPTYQDILYNYVKYLP